MNTIELNELPLDTRRDVLSTLKAFSRVYVTRENGEYSVCASFGLDTRVKASDFETFEFHNTDFYTEDEIDNFNKALPELW